MTNVGHLSDPPWISLQTTFKYLLSRSRLEKCNWNHAGNSGNPEKAGKLPDGGNRGWTPRSPHSSPPPTSSYSRLCSQIHDLRNSPAKNFHQNYGQRINIFQRQKKASGQREVKNTNKWSKFASHFLYYLNVFKSSKEFVVCRKKKRS